MKILVSSSYRFASKWDEIKKEIGSRGHSCTTPKDIDLELFGQCEDLSASQALEGAKRYYELIKETDVLYALNFDGYIGKAVAQEIGYAKGLGKKVVLLEKPQEPFIALFTDQVAKPGEIGLT